MAMGSSIFVLLSRMVIPASARPKHLIKFCQSHFRRFSALSGSPVWVKFQHASDKGTREPRSFRRTRLYFPYFKVSRVLG
jgi:hypothetical protein